MSALSSVGSSALTGLNTSGIQFSGLISGIDTNQIIQGLLAVQQAQVTNLQNNQAQITKQQTAFKTVEAKLLDLQNQASALDNTFNNVLNAQTATSSNQGLVTASASTSAQPGVFSFRVASLANAEVRASQGFASASSTVGQGTLQVRVGNGATQTITLDSTNNTLQGVANAINSLGSDVTASVVKGSSGQPYHLLLTSNRTGAANTISLTSTPAGGGGGGPQLDLSNVVQAAGDASITLGSGAGALTVTSPDNQVENVFNGVTLNLQGADPTQTVSVTVAPDTATAKKAVEDFVNSFNALSDYINQNSTYDPQTSTAGIFLGDINASNIEYAVTNAITNVVAGLPSSANNLTALGITLNAQGDLVIDDNKLTQALSGQAPGITPDAVRRLFALDGQSTNDGVQFVFANDSTRVGEPIQVNVTQVATHASLTGTTGLTGPITIGSNNTLSLTVDGQSATLTLAQQTYATPQDLVQEIQSELNSNTALASTNAQVSLDGSNRITITSQAYGAGSQVTATGGTALTALGLTQGASSQGVNVAGNFVVNGVTETAHGNGQFLTGDSTNASTANLEVRVALTAAPVGPAATLTVTRGLASQLGKVLNASLDPVNGRLKTIDQSFQDRIDSIQQEIDRENVSIQQRQQDLLQQFTDMETAISQLQAAGNLLSSQFNSIKVPTPNSSSSSSSSSSGSSTIG
jgi:flagellar hook-associated protein 2